MRFGVLCARHLQGHLLVSSDNEIEFCKESKYLGVIFDTSGTDDKEIRSREIQARKCIACRKGYYGVKT
jgi:hypothetical protein